MWQNDSPIAEDFGMASSITNQSSFNLVLACDRVHVSSSTSCISTCLRARFTEVQKLSRNVPTELACLRGTDMKAPRIGLLPFIIYPVLHGVSPSLGMAWQREMVELRK